MSDDRHDAVSRRAYELWEREGGGHGRHEDHWHQAVGEVGAESSEPADGGPVAAPDGTTLNAGPAETPSAADAVASAPKRGGRTAAPRKTKTTAK